jgi:DNA-binding XRE family transcriptional regulator
MDQYVTGAIIKKLRDKRQLTQIELADLIHVSDKTVSKWENGKSFPDISLLQTLAEAFNVSVVELLDGNAVHNTNVSANMLRSKFYSCPMCGNVIHSMGEMVLSCHGITLPALEAESVDERHAIKIDLFMRLFI